MNSPAKNLFSQSIDCLVNSLELSLTAAPNWNAFFAHLLAQTSAKGFAMVCSFPNFSYETHLDQNLNENRQYDHVVSGSLLNWTYEIRFFFATSQQKKEFLSHDHLLRSINTAMTLVLKNIGFQLKQKMIDACVDNLGLGIFKLDHSGCLSETNIVADELIKSQYCMIRHGKVIICKRPDWVVEKIRDSKKNKNTNNKPNDYISIMLDEGVMSCLILPDSGLCSGYSLVVCLNNNQVSVDALKLLIGVDKSKAEVVTAFMKGLSADEVANQTGYKKNTIYSYIKSLYEGGNISRQAQLTAVLFPRLPHCDGVSYEVKNERKN